MNSIQNSPDILAALRQRKHAVRKKLKASREQMIETASCLTGPMPKGTSNVQRISRLVASGIAIYRGFRLCTSIVSGLHSLFTPRKRRR